MLNRILLVCLFITSFTLRAQTSSYVYKKNISSQNGLPQNSVRDLAFSTNGFLWIATEGGLARYDGKEIKLFDTKSEHKHSNRISQIVSTLDENKYFITSEFELFQIKEQHHQMDIKFVDTAKQIPYAIASFFRPANLQEFNFIYKRISTSETYLNQTCSIFKFKDKKCYVQIVEKGYNVFDESFHLIQKIIVEHNDTKHYFTKDNTLYFYDDKSGFFNVDIKNGSLKKLNLEDANYLNNSNASYSLNKNKIIYNKNTGTTFYVLNNSLYEINPLNDKIQLTKLIDSLPNKSISTITYNPNHEYIIIGTNSDGCYLFRQPEFNVIAIPNKDNSFYAQTNAANYQGVLSMTDNQIEFLGLQQAYRISTSFATNHNTILLQANQFLWVSSSDSLYCYNLKLSKIVKRICIPNNNYTGIDILAKRNQESFYIVTPKAFYYYKLDSGLHKLTTIHFSSYYHRTYTFLQEGDSVVWLGTHEGLYKYSFSTNQISQVALKNKVVRSLFRTSSGHLLAGTYGNGYYAIEGSKEIPIPLDKKGYLKTVHTFIEDKKTYLWMTSNNGLFKIKLDELDQYLQHKNKNPLYYFRFTDLNGFNTNEFNGGCYPNSLKVNDSVWSIPSMNGLIWFNPENIYSTCDAGTIFIDKIILNDTSEVNLSDTIIDTKTHNFRLSIYTASSNWSDDNNLFIEYRIQDDTKSNLWTLLEDNKTPILLQNLSGGTHTLLIRKKNGAGLNDYTTIALTIRVPKKLTEYGCFIPLAILLSVAFIYVLLKLSRISSNRRKRKLEQLVKEKTFELRQAVEGLQEKNTIISISEHKLKKENELKNTLLFLLSHDIATPLRFMNLYISKLETKDAIAIHKEDLFDMSISIQNLQNLLDNIVTWIKQTLDKNDKATYQNVLLNTLVNEKVKLFSLILKRKGLLLENNIPSETLLFTDPFIVSVAIQNVLSNAINFSKKGTIKIAYSILEDKHCICVSNEGTYNIQNTSTYTSINSDDTEYQLQEPQLTGYGIGLKISNKLLSLIHGYSELSSDLKTNRTFAKIFFQSKHDK